MDRYEDLQQGMPDDMEFRILNWIGIINQLAGNLAQASLHQIDLPMPEFLMLNHFVHNPEEGKTVADVCRARQQQQPGASKTIQKLLAKKLLRSKKNPTDARSKLLFITDRGIAAHAAGVTQLSPILNEAFSGISDHKKQQLFNQLDILKQWFDNNRRS